MIDPDKALAAYLETGKGFYGGTVTATAYDAFKKGVAFAQTTTALDVSRAIELDKVMPKKEHDDIGELIATAQYLQTVQHWEAQARCKIVAEIAKRMLEHSNAPQEAAVPVAIPQAWRDSLAMTVARLEEDADMFDQCGQNSTAEDRRARAYEISVMLAAPAVAQQEAAQPEQDALVPCLTYQTTYADLARLTPEQIFRRWLDGRTAAAIAAVEAFEGGLEVGRASLAAPIGQDSRKDGETWTVGQTFEPGERDHLTHRWYAGITVSEAKGMFQNGILVAGWTKEEAEQRRDGILAMRSGQDSRNAVLEEAQPNCQAEFEKTCKGYDLTFSESLGNYVDDATQEAWFGWQGAWYRSADLLNPIPKETGE